jgi:DNA-binding MarR family transcriptional regulator
MSKATYPASRHDKPHARLYDEDLHHPAWVGLSHLAFRIHAELLARYRPTQPNSFPVGAGRIARSFRTTEPTAKKAIDELIAGGFLEEQRKGRNRGIRAGRERVVSLTRWPTETRNGQPSLPRQLWEGRN